MPSPPPVRPFMTALRAALGPQAEAGSKRELLERLQQRQGESALIVVGRRAILDNTRHPVVEAIGRAPDAQQILERWRELERFGHSRHRIRVEPQRDRAVVVRRITVDDQIPPRPTNLWILGVLHALLEAGGCRHVEASIGQHPVITGASVEAPPPSVPVHTWTLRWADRAPPPEPSAIVLPLPDPVGRDPLIHRVVQVLSGDLMRRWTLADVADALKMSPRTLQRRLTARGTRFSALLPAARVAHACTLLGHEHLPPAEIAFACGFADQAHLTRTFRALVDVPPVAFRSIER